MYKLSIIVITFLFLFSCKKVDKLTQFDLKYDSSVTVESTFGMNVPFDIYTPDISTNSESSFESNDTRKDLIESIVLKTMTMSISSPTGQDFSFLKSIEIYISADGLSDAKIAWKDNISDSTTILNLETSSADLKEYIKKSVFNLKVTTTTDEVLSQDYQIDIHSVYAVDAKILGL